MIKAYKRLMTTMRREDGTATMEFVLMIPLLLALFTASFESGMLMTRHIMLERALDITMRELRLGHYTSPDLALLKTEICSRTLIINDCANVVSIYLQPVSKVTWDLPAGDPACIDRSQPITPAASINPGVDDEVMLVRVCVVVDALFPTTGIALNLPKDGNGGYWLVSKSAFVNEPS